MALAALVPLAILLRPARRVDRAEPDPVVEAPAAAGAARPVGAASIVVAVASATLAVFATTATSCLSNDSVTRVVPRGSVVFAEVLREGGPETVWARSDDGGETWRSTVRPEEVPAPPAEPVDPTGGGATTIPVPRRDQPPAGPLTARLGDGSSIELAPEEEIREVGADGAARTTFDYRDWRASRVSDPCSWDGAALGSVGVVQHDGTEVPVVALGDAGVLIRSKDGSWTQRDVLTAVAPRDRPDHGPARLGLLANLLAVVGVAAIGRRRRWPSWGWGAATSATVLASMLVAFGFVAFNAFELPVVAIVCSVLLNVGAGVAVGRSRLFAPAPPPPPFCGWPPVARPDLPPPPDSGPWRPPPPPRPPGPGWWPQDG